MDFSENRERLIHELEDIAKSRNDGRKNRQLMSIFVTLFALLVIPPLFPMLWLSAVQISLFVDARISKALLSIRHNRLPLRFAYALAVAGIAISSILFAVFGPVLWLSGGDSGKLLASLMLSSALVQISLYHSQTRVLYFVSSTPFVVAFAFLPLQEHFLGQSIDIGSMIAVFGGLILFAISGAKAKRWIQSLISQHKEALEKADASNARLSAINRALDQHAMVSISDKEGLLYEVNDLFCEKVQYSREELVGNNITMLDSDLHDTAFFTNMQDTVSSGQIWSGQIQNKAKDGSAYWADVTISPVKDASGKITSCVSIRRDITKLQEATEEAKRANQSKSEFLAMMSHELRTPMNAVLGMAELLKGTSLDDQQQEYITTLNDGGKMLMTLLNDILDLSKIEAGKMQIETIDVDIRHAIKRLERLWGPNSKDKGLNFICHIEDDVPSVIRGDITRIQQVIYNLVSNAVKFTEVGEVRLEVSSENSSKETAQIRFAITDTGIGIAPKALKQLFTSFEQADRSITRKFGGTGLGLAISKQLANMMNGDIEVTSKLGKGTTFTFYIEATVVSQKSPKKGNNCNTKNVKNTKAKNHRLRILVAEDNVLNQRVLKAFLKPFEHEIVFAEDGVEALIFLRAEGFDLVLMDIQMPRMDGKTATKQLRTTNGPNTHTPVIAMTANAMEGDRQDCLDAGMDDYVSKPIDPRLLFTAIARVNSKTPPQKSSQKKTA